MKAGRLPSGTPLPETGAGADMPEELVATLGPKAISPDDPVSSGPAFLNPGGFASATCDEEGVVRFAEDRFGFAPGAQLDRLPARGQARVSLLTASDGRTAAVAVAGPQAAAEWPLAETVRRALLAGEARYAVLICLSPAAADPANTQPARLLGLSGPEARVAAGLVETGDMRRAAQRAGMGYETARKLAKSAMRKAGVRRQGELVGLWVALQTGETVSQPALAAALGALFPIGARQAEIAAIVADGGSRKDAGDALGVSEHAVKAELKAVFTALQVPTVAALSVLISEVRILTRLVHAVSLEATATAPAADPLRLIPRVGRPGRIALLDHGPRGALPVLILHTATTSRHNPQSFIRALQSHGLRPIAFDRPGFGLSSMVEGDYLAQSAQDMADILDTLGIDRAAVMARGGTMVLSRFAARWGDRMLRAVAVNPEPPSGVDRKRVGLTGVVKTLVYGKPWLTGALASYLGRNASAGIVERLVLRSLESSEADRRVLSDPEVRTAYVQSSQLSALQGAAGFRAVAGAEPFQPAIPIADGRRITILCGAQDPLYNAADSVPPWEAVWPGASVVIVPDAGRLVHFQKPELIARLLLD
ncbi:alpha/beta fold hydrolase [Sphingomonas sp. LB-2]|uniref:alpha/beta fold hydrolase n=1 Tax=Sphingomonas caeni TaxID=2984949 RepID=UPI00223031A6|nr:alpha/beta fold hydrolase [Sphingomonas caeni]MCW3849594.1 alpha/beta fold hydrolase [Sphingomonas caeni]